MSSLNRTVLLVAAFALCGTGVAAPALNFDKGRLIGASGVLVDGESLDVSFIDGPFKEVFPGWLSSTFYFTTAAGAAAASHALLDQVLVNVPGHLLDDDPSLVAGIESTNVGVIYTPYVVRTSMTPTGPVQLYTAWGAMNFNPSFGGLGNPDTLTIDYRELTFDSSISPLITYAVWTDHVERPISEPAGVSLVGFALAALAISRRARHHRSTLVSMAGVLPVAANARDDPTIAVG
jgi:hypothetical protein